MLACLSLFPHAFAGPMRVARTRQAHDEYLRQRQLSDRERKLNDIVYRGSEPPLHMFETKSSFDKERREEERRNQGGAASSSRATPIRYHGGPVMSGETLNVYLIYYGSWPAGSGQDVIENFIQSLSLSGSDAQGEAGDPKKTSPNGNPGLDATISTIAHEIAEAATDPDASTGWFDADNEENADKCSYVYGETLTTQNEKGQDAKYNLVGLNNMTFLVQQNWDLETDSCVVQGIK
ncbi:unnamed protein product [Closterium sp. NIES-65]|nr:unnamed protein product [Closterium sp. NIES-65]